MTRRSDSAFTVVDGRESLRRQLLSIGFREVEGRWLDDLGRTPAQMSFGCDPGDTVTYYVATWGCQMNEHDSEILSGQLETMGYQPAESFEDADLILLNTCAIRETAEEKVFGTIGWLKQLKVRRPEIILGICGCMAQEPATVRRIKQNAPHVDVVFGTHNIHKLPELIHRVRREESMVIDVWKTGGAVLENLPAKRAEGTRAWVTIQYGCDKFCTYCIVPYVRGRERSRAPEEILKEVRELGRQGFREVTLLGQTVSSYGQDFVDRSYDFAQLLLDLDTVDGIEWIRYMSPYPSDFDERLAEALGRCRKVCRHVHLPLQSGSNRILRRMNRRYTREEFLSAVERLRRVMPDLSVTTDIIVGFPGESEEDFAQTLEMVREVRFDNAFTFWFSPREGTVGAKWEEREGLPLSVKKDRLQRLMDVQNVICLEINKTWVGRREKVLVEGPSKKDPSVISARTSQNKVVLIPNGNPSFAGTFAEVEVTGASTFFLEGRFLEQTPPVHASPPVPSATAKRAVS